MRKLISVFFISVIVSACHKENKDFEKLTSDPDFYNRTVYLLNDVLMNDNFNPVVASRAYAYSNIAAYECIAAGYPGRFETLAGQLKDLKPLPKPGDAENINFELAATLAFAKVGTAMAYSEYIMKDYIDSLKKQVTLAGMPEDILSSSENFALAISNAVVQWSKSDHFKETRKERYVLKNIAGSWQPTPPMYAPAVEPAWNKVRTMVMDSANQFLPPAPYDFDIENKNSPYYKEVMMVKNTGDSLTKEQKHIADFWDDNPFKLNQYGHANFASKKFSPPAHWMGIVGIGAKAAKADFQTTVCTYAKTSVALFEAFIQCWNIKYRDCTARPVTVINEYIDHLWKPHLQTPPFPEYTCGHSTSSAAAAEALTDVLGDNVSYTDTTELEFGIPNRTFSSFRQAAVENNWARFYGGIHFHYSCETANEYGKKVGALVVKKLKMEKKKQ
ncbi:MAG TPA: vanadium-dependent haloperoxidase [Bacteroidia bacterium]|nr:vanadium-dependent haloperoxidase [Bacteroidia bacterium]